MTATTARAVNYYAMSARAEQMMWKERRDEYLAWIEPWIRLKVHIYNISAPTITIYADGTRTCVYSAQIQDMLDKCDTGIAEIRDMLERKWNK